MKAEKVLMSLKLVHCWARDTERWGKFKVEVQEVQGNYHKWSQQPIKLFNYCSALLPNHIISSLTVCKWSMAHYRCTAAWLGTETITILSLLLINFLWNLLNRVTISALTKRVLSIKHDDIARKCEDIWEKCEKELIP